MIRTLLLLTILPAVLLASSATAQEPEMTRRQKVTPALQQMLQSAEGPLKVIVRMRGRRDVAVASQFTDSSWASRLAVRREEARRSASEFLQFLAGHSTAAEPKGPAAPRASVLGGSAVPPRPTELWIANSVCVEATPELVREMASRSDVEAVYRDVRIQVVPVHELSAAGQPGEASAWGISKLGADRVWDVHGFRGNGVVVGHIDTGVDALHPSLAGRVLRFRDFVNGRAEAYDDEGHGTHTAGILCGSGGLGVAPGARLVVAKALDARGAGQLSTLLAAMQWMLDPDGNPATDDRPVCVSNSWGVERKVLKSLGAEETFFWDAVQAWRDGNILPVFASGNGGANSESVPAGYPTALAVGATDANGGASQFSTGGNTTWNGVTYQKPDLCAPGGSILSAMPGGKFQGLSGSSMACPHVAGLVALLKQARPSATAQELENLLRTTTNDLGPAGFDTRFGIGQVDAMAAVNAALSLPVAARPSVQPSPATQAAPQLESAKKRLRQGLLGLMIGLAAIFGLSMLG